MPRTRAATEEAADAAFAKGIRVIVLRLPQVHDTRRRGSIGQHIQLARKTGPAGVAMSIGWNSSSKSTSPCSASRVRASWPKVNPSGREIVGGPFGRRPRRVDAPSPPARAHPRTRTRRRLQRTPRLVAAFRGPLDRRALTSRWGCIDRAVIWAARQWPQSRGGPRGRPSGVAICSGRR